MTKVIVTKEVAEAIERYLDGDDTYREKLLEEHAGIYSSGANWSDFYDGKVYNALDSVSLIEMAEILVNGYEVEKSPEENVRDYFTALKLREEYVEKSGHSGSQHRQGWQSVEETLRLLGIKIEGVND